MYRYMSTQLSRTSELLLSALTPQSRKSHILPRLVQNSFISVGELCDIGCDIIFTRDKVEVTKDGKSVMSGICDQQSRLWRVDLKETSKMKYSPVCNHAHKTSNLKVNKLSACYSVQPSEIHLDKGHQEWKLCILARTNRTSSCKILIQIIRNSQRALESKKDVCMIHAT
jgi:hypothetical protein